MYYEDKTETLKRIFGEEDVVVKPDSLMVAHHHYPIVDDVIILSEPNRKNGFVKERAAARTNFQTDGGEDRAEDVRISFGAEWRQYSEFLPEHAREFSQYFDLVDLSSLQRSLVCDLGCGTGRWSYFLKDACREIILVDFSEAIFVARKNLTASRNCLFFKGDLRALPFRDDFCDFLFCLGVLHHLPTSCLDEVRRLRRLAPRLLIFLYSAFDNRPAYFRALLGPVTLVRRILCKIRQPLFRKVFSRAGALLMYRPLIYLGWLLRPLHLASHVPLYDFYHDKSLRRIEQDVYDRFFTRIEQRVTRSEILELRDTFIRIVISENLPYWHFLCMR
jgi:SAM-dependent methyltransferase